MLYEHSNRRNATKLGPFLRRWLDELTAVRFGPDETLVSPWRELDRVNR